MPDKTHRKRGIWLFLAVAAVVVITGATLMVDSFGGIGSETVYEQGSE
ncbi:hypothetical protein [Tranquillimonas alkanivorans]|uniref:Uncharacterized protein n=1 Tax=Tranquillimonas alkanivorans TaxID=441119 RepID=A0A1I5T2A6_9RHOB|nr:hypothetical protein [Tranquillimonas alkanivorans]SFP77194.1 hypothetical protein SAMN04488047_112116 [Tranquillimonas alkanivorans]